MPDQAIYADAGKLRELDQAISGFEGDFEDALRSMDQRLARTEGWIAERVQHWKRRVTSAKAGVEQAAAALSACQAQTYRDSEGNLYIPDCSRQEVALAAAQRELAKTEAELRRTIEWQVRIDKAAATYRRRAQGYRSFVSTSLGPARAALSQHAAALDDYSASGIAPSLALLTLTGLGAAAAIGSQLGRPKPTAASRPSSLRGDASAAGESLGPHADRPIASPTLESIVQSARIRAEELQRSVPVKSQGWVTMAVGIGRDHNGRLRTVVGTNEARSYMRRGVSINLLEERAGGFGHAEADIAAYMEANGIRMLTIAAGRPICSECAAMVRRLGASFASALKEPV